MQGPIASILGGCTLIIMTVVSVVVINYVSSTTGFKTATASVNCDQYLKQADQLESSMEDYLNSSTNEVLTLRLHELALLERYKLCEEHGE